MAVHGAAARMMHPAMYWSASAGEIHGLKSRRKNTHAISAIENGLTSQFTKSVTKRPRGRRPTLRIAPKSTFITMGVIISQIRMAIGMLIWLPSPNSRRRRPSITAGANPPSATPAIMHRPTHRVR
jgi:hypothetical protein